MKSIPISFMTPNSINKHLTCLPNAYTHIYMKCLRFGAIFRHTSVTQTFMDPCGPQPVYALCGHIFSLFSVFFLSYFSLKRHYHSLHYWQSYDRLSPSSQHHVWLHPPIFSCLLHILLLFVRTFSPYFTCINQVDTTLYLTSIWVLFSLGRQLSKSWYWLHCSHQALWLLLPVTSWSYH